MNNNPTLDFAFYQPVSVGSTVFFDVNNNGQQDAGDNGIPGIVVQLLTDLNGDGVINLSEVAAATTTDALGNYFFDNLSAPLWAEAIVKVSA